MSERPELQELLRALEDPAPPRGSKERSWARLSATPGFRFRAPRWLLVAAAAAIAAVLWAGLRPSPPVRRARLLLTAGEVQDGERQGLSAGAELAPGRVLRTGRASRALAQLPDAEVLVGEGATVSLSSGEGGSRISLGAGRVVVSAQKRPASRALVVEASGIEVRVVGTLFAVERTEQRVEVRVEEGRVIVRDASGERPVSAGQAWSSVAGLVEGAVPPEEALLLRAFTSPATGAVLRVESAAEEEVELDGLKLGRGPLAVLASEGAHRVRAPGDSQERKVVLAARAEVVLEARTEAPPPVTGGRVQPAAVVVQTETHTHPKTRPVHPERSRGGLEAQATPEIPAHPERSRGALEAQATPEIPAHPERSRGALEAQATPEIPAHPERSRGALAAAPAVHPEPRLVPAAAPVAAGPIAPAALHPDIALYDSARRRLAAKDPRGAVQAFRAYQHKYPDGSLREEADLGLVEALLADGAWSEAAAEVDRLLAARPELELRDALVLARANARRRQGDCALALRDYEALDGAQGEVGEDALYLRSFCAAQRGPDEVAPLLERYRQRYPSGRHLREVEAALRALR